MRLLQVNKIHVKQSRIILELSVSKDTEYSNKKIACAILKQFPNIKLHKCKNFAGQKLVDVLHNTSIAHILEHIIIDLQIQALPNQAQKVELLGFTEEVNCEPSSGNKKYKIEITYYDDLVCLDAINKGCNFLNQLV